MFLASTTVAIFSWSRPHSYRSNDLVWHYARHQLGLSEELVRSLLVNSTMIEAPMSPISADSYHFKISARDNPLKYRNDVAFHKTMSPAWFHQYRLQSLRPGATVVDIGANVGIVPTVLDQLATRQARCSTAAHPAYRVLSVEPVPENVLFLKYNIAEMQRKHEDHRDRLGTGVPCEPRVRALALNRAVTGDGRNVTLAIGSASMSAHVVGSSTAPRKASRAEVSTGGSTQEDAATRTYLVGSTCLERLLDEHGVGDVDLLKLDCEGCEYEVFDELRAKPSLRRRIKGMAGELHACHPRLPTRQRCVEAIQFVQEHWPAPPTDASLMKPHGFAIV